MVSTVGRLKDFTQTIVVNVVNKLQSHYLRYTSTSPLPENRKDENRKMWKLKDMKIVAAEISLINSVPIRILKFSRVLTLSKTRPSSDV